MKTAVFQYKIGVLFFAFTCYVMPVKSQSTIPDVSLPSPNAMSLGLFGEIPVSNFTGIPDINIPIFNLKNGSIALPISFIYHAGGVRPDQMPSWSGLNWNLNAGGCITRTVKDLPDEYDLPNTTLKRSLLSLPDFFTSDSDIKGVKAGYYFNYNVNRGLDWADPAKIISLVSDKLDGKDTEPDRFIFRFNSIQGEFFLDENGEWKVKSDCNIKVVFQNENFIDLPPSLLVSKTKHGRAWCSKYTDNLKSFGGFTLITDDGVQYVFGTNTIENNTDAIEYSIPFFYQLVEQWVATSWYLKKVIAADGKTIDLTYEPDDYISNMFIFFRWQVEYFKNGNNRISCGGYGPSSEFGNNEWAVDWINPRYASYLGNLIRPVYLKKIESSNLLISFERENSNHLKYNKEIYLKNKDLMDVLKGRSVHLQICNGHVDEGYWPYLYDVVKTIDYDRLLDALVWKKLKSITISSKYNTSVGWKYIMGYNDNVNERLMLKSVKQVNLSESLINSSYEFEYYDDPNIQLPAFLDEGTDHWGFYNGNTIKTFTLPRTSHFIDYGPPNLGGNLDLIYNLKNPTNNIDIAQEGSLRKIIYPTGGFTEFEYQQHDYSKSIKMDGCSSGNLIDSVESFSEPKFAGGLRIKKIITQEDSNSHPISKSYFYVSGYELGKDPSSLPSSGILGNDHKYVWWNVDEKTGHSNVQVIERLIYGSQTILPLSTNWKGNHVGYSQVIEKFDDNSYVLYEYTNFISKDGSHFDENPLPGSYNDLTPYTSYTDNSFERGRLIYKVSFNNLGDSVQSEDYKYERINDGFARSLFLNANTYVCSGDNYTAFRGYPYKNQFYKYVLMNKNVSYYYNANPAIFTYNYFFNYNSSNLLSQQIVHQSDGDSLKTKYRYPQEIIALDNGSMPRNDIRDALVSMARGNHMLNYPIEIVKYNNNKVIEATVNTYIGHPASSDNINLYQTYKLETASPITDYTNAYFNPIPDWPITIDTRSKILTTFDNYDSYGNLLQYHNEDDINTSFIWGYNQAYPIIKAENIDYTTLYAVVTSIQSNLETFLTGTVKDCNKDTQKAVWKTFNETLRSNSLLKNAHISTYTYAPLIGITSQTDPNGITTYYEYDDFGRLKFIRDNDGNITNNYQYKYATGEPDPDNASPYIEINKTKLIVNGNQTEECIKIETNRSWNIINTCSWISTNVLSGQGSQLICLNILKNETGKERIGSFKISSPYTGETTVTVSQKSGQFIVDLFEYWGDQYGHRKICNVTSDLSWRVESENEWIIILPFDLGEYGDPSFLDNSSFPPATGNGDGQFFIYMKSNAGNAASIRRGKITITLSNGFKHIIDVSQSN